ncbi:hypothetical protein [Luteolibacter sp. Populi]|uniref:hypothetical protein n=1 Tax=Luteolibacter sp. Populi TaxID=3230487 RepID=UPI003465E12F
MKHTERIAWAVITLAAVLWNVMGGGGEKSPPHPSGVEGSRDEQAGNRSTRSPRSGSSSRDERAGRDSANRASIKVRSLMALRADNPLSRMTQFLELLASCDATGFEEMSEALDELKRSGIFHPELDALVNFRAGQLKGADLMKGRTGTAADFEMIGALRGQYEGWIQADPAAAGHWLETLPAGKFKDRMAMAYIAAASKDDPLGAMKLVSSLHPSQQASAGRAVVQRLEESATIKDASMLLRTLEASAGTGEASYLKGMFEALADGAVKAGNPDALSVLESHIGGSYVSGSSLARISEAKGKADPVAALEWAAGVAGTEGGRGEGALLSATIGGMDLGDLDIAEEWAQGRQEWPGVAAMQASLDMRRRILEDRGDDANDYDGDD